MLPNYSPTRRMAGKGPNKRRDGSNASSAYKPETFWKAKVANVRVESQPFIHLGVGYA